MRSAITGLLVGAALVVLGAFGASAGAEEYILAYEGNDLPQNQGWMHSWNEPNAVCWIEDGALVIDASADRRTCEWYEYYRNGLLWPCSPVEWGQPGSHFFMEWRLKMENYSGVYYSTSIALRARDCWGVGFGISDETIRSVFEPGLIAEFEPGVFHEFELRSSDMRTYELLIDGALAIEGLFYQTTSSERIAWGEAMTASASLSRWDYFRVGVAPEPGSAVAMIVLVAGASLVRRRSL